MPAKQCQESLQVSLAGLLVHHIVAIDLTLGEVWLDMIFVVDVS